MTKRSVIQTNKVLTSKVLTTRNNDDYNHSAQSAGVIVANKDAPQPKYTIIWESADE